MLRHVIIHDKTLLLKLFYKNDLSGLGLRFIHSMTGP